MTFFSLIFFVIILVSVNAGIHTNDYYISFPDKSNWYAALRYCNYHGMYLIDIPTDLEYNNIQNLIGQNNKTQLAMIWTSGTRLGSNFQYYWATTGHAFMYTNWVPGQPDNTPYEKCLLLWDVEMYRFADYSCDTELTFICRKKYIEPYLLSKHKQCARINFQGESF